MIGKVLEAFKTSKAIDTVTTHHLLEMLCSDQGEGFIDGHSIMLEKGQ